MVCFVINLKVSGMSRQVIDSVTYRVLRQGRAEDRELIVLEGQPYYCSTGTSVASCELLKPDWRQGIWMPFEGVEERGRLMKSSEGRSTDALERFVKTNIEAMRANGELNDVDILALVKSNYLDPKHGVSVRDVIQDIASELGRYATVEKLGVSLAISRPAQGSLLHRLSQKLAVHQRELELANKAVYTIDVDAVDGQSISQLNAWLDRQRQLTVSDVGAESRLSNQADGHSRAGQSVAEIYRIHSGFFSLTYHRIKRLDDQAALAYLQQRHSNKANQSKPRGATEVTLDEFNTLVP